MPSTRLTMTPALRRLLHWLGGTLAAAGVLFVAIRLHAYWLALDFSRLTSTGWCQIFLLAVVYGAANLLLARAWWYLLCHFGAARPRYDTLRIYGMSQLAKYVPGNIFHLAGRQALGMAAGIASGALAKATIWELGSIAVAGALFGWTVLPLVSPGFSQQAAVLLLLLSCILVAVVLRRVAGRETALAFLCQVLFLLISSAVFVALLKLLGGYEALGAQAWLPIGSAYIFAWLVGLVTPGAPAGVGIREMILLFLLNAIVAEEGLLMAVLLGRVVTVAGDLMFFAAATCIPSNLRTPEKQHE